MTKRLLIVTTIPATFDAFLAPYARAAAARGWEVDLATGTGGVRERDAVGDVFEISWSRRISDPRNFMTAIRAFRRVVRTREYDVVHMHTPIASTAARAAFATMPRRRRPYLIYTAHGFHFGVGGINLRHAPIVVAEWLAGRITDRLVVINETDLRNARRLRIVNPRHIVHHHGIGVDLDWYDRTLVADPDSVRASLGIDAAPLFTIVASLHPGKGHLDALQALAAMRTQDAHLAFAGDGILEPELRSRVQELRLEDRVHFLGQVSDVRGLVVSSTATVLPSRREGLSTATLESLCLGTPVIGCDIRGIADTVRPDGGRLVPVGDVRALADAMQAAADAPLLDDLGRRAVRERMETYSISAILDAHERLYETAHDPDAAPTSLVPSTARGGLTPSA